MTQENKPQPTKSEKEAFFAAYWGVSCLITHYDYQESFNGAIFNPNAIEQIFLTPLSKITDEDAIEVARINNSHRKEDLTFDLWRNNYGPVVKVGIKDKEGWIEIINICQAKLSLPCYDFLRSKGYLLPFRNYTTEQLTLFGWVKIKE